MSEINRNKVLLYRTNTLDAVVTYDMVDEGELAMNLHQSSPFLMFKNSAGDIVKIGTLTNELGESEYLTVSQKGINAALKLPNDYSVTYPKVDSTSFTETQANATFSEAIKNIDSNLSSLIQEMLDNEEVIAAAFSKINESCGFNENCEYIVNESSNYLSNATSLQNADELLDSNMSRIDNSLTELKTIVNSLTGITGDSVENIEQLSGQVSELSAKVETNITNISNISGIVTNHTTDITNLTTSATTLNGKVDDLETDVDALKNKQTLSNIIINEIEGEVDESTSVASLKLDADNISLSSEYEAVVYPTIQGNENYFTSVTSASSVEESIKQVDSNIAQLVQEVLNNETVCANAFTEIKESVGLNENLLYVKSENSNYINIASSLYEADVLLDSAVKGLDERITTIEGEVGGNISNIIDSVNEIDEKYLSAVSINSTNGTVSDKVASFTLDGSNLKLSSSYESATYQEIDEDVVFTPVAAESTIDTAINQLDSTISQLVDEVLKNEVVVSNALTTINDSCGFDINAKYIVPETSNYISVASSLYEADLILDDELNKISESVEVIKNQSYGGYIYIEEFDKENFYNALSSALNSLSEGEDAIIDCTYFKGQHTITQGFQINNPVKLIFGGIDLTFDNPSDSNLFTFNCNNISIVGLNRNTDKTQTDNGATIFRMTNPDSTLNGYHIKSRGNKNILIEGITLKGLRTTMGRQYGNEQYPIDGVGGIYIEKAKPEVVEASNTCNNTRIENVSIAGSKAHGIYIDTPILSTFKNIRLSDCGGHGIFVNNGTSLMIENVYSSSANMAGFCIYGASYVSLNNCASENSGIGFWIRSAFNVTLMSPGVEETRTYGKTPWRLSQPISGKYGLGLTTLSSDNTSVVEISDVNTEYSEYFIGYGILISGGRSINVFTPYVKTIGETIAYEAYSGGTSLSNEVKFINIVGNNRSSFIMNPGFKEASDSSVPTNIKHEIGIGVDVEKLELIYDTNSTLLQGTLDSTTYVTNKDERAPIYCKSTSCVIRSGKELITNYNAETPTSDTELANKLYVDTKVSNIAVNLTDAYGSGITYDQVGEGDNDPTVAMSSCTIGDNLDTVVNTLERNINLLANEINENEFVAANALTDLNNRLEVIEMDMSVVKEQIATILSRLETLENS